MWTNGAYRQATDAGRPGPKWPSKIESILGTCMSQNLSRDRRLAWPASEKHFERLISHFGSTMRKQLNYSSPASPIGLAQ